MISIDVPAVEKKQTYLPLNIVMIDTDNLIRNENAFAEAIGDTWEQKAR